jgi:hypothetical protein
MINPSKWVEHCQVHLLSIHGQNLHDEQLLAVVHQSDCY